MRAAATLRLLSASGCAIAVLLLASQAGAALIDLGNVTRDSSSGLDWLDLTETLNLSMNDVTNDVGGFISDGWQPANGSQVCGLLAQVQAPSPCPGFLTVTFDVALAAAQLDLINLLGVTSSNPINQYSFGWYAGDVFLGGGDLRCSTFLTFPGWK